MTGRGPADATRIALDKGSATAGGYRVGDRVRVATSGPVRTYTLSGVFTTDDGAVDAGGGLVLFDTAEAQRLYLSPGHFRTASVTAAPGASQERVLAAVEPSLPRGATADTAARIADREAESNAHALSALNEMLLAFAGIALFVGVFLISNTFTMLVAQRSRELALLRAVGASRRQVRGSVLAEAGLLGFVASVAGYGLGLGLAVGLRTAMTSFGARIPNGPLTIRPDSLVAAFAVGVLITVVAAWLPARRAARIPPVAAMGSAYLPATTRSLVVRNCVGAFLAAVGAAGIAAGAAVGADDGRLLVAGGALLMLIGVIILIPLLSRPAVALVRPLLRGLFGTPGTLASRNAVRNPRHTGATASALAIGLTLVTGLTVLGVTMSATLDRLTTDNLRADYLVSMAAGGTLAPSTVPALAGADGVTTVSPEQAVGLVIDGDRHPVSAVTPGAVDKVLRLTADNGSLRSLAAGQLAVATDLAADNDWRVGDTVPVRYDDGVTAKLRIGVTYPANPFLSQVLVDSAVVRPHERTVDITAIWVRTAGGASAAHERALAHALGDSPAFKVSDRADIRARTGGVIATALDILYALLAMALVIAVLGVVNTLAMSVFERQREIGVLRAIGLDRAKVRRMIRLESVVISLFGAVVGVGLGVFLAWAIGRTFKDSVPGYALILPWSRIVVFLALAGLVGVLASLWPARSAARTDMLTAIRTD